MGRGILKSVRQRAFCGLLAMCRGDFVGILPWPQPSALIDGEALWGKRGERVAFHLSCLLAALCAAPLLGTGWWRGPNEGRRNKGTATILSAAFHATPLAGTFPFQQWGPLVPTRERQHFIFNLFCCYWFHRFLRQFWILWFLWSLQNHRLSRSLSMESDPTLDCQTGLVPGFRSGAQPKHAGSYRAHSPNPGVWCQPWNVRSDWYAGSVHRWTQCKAPDAGDPRPALQGKIIYSSWWIPKTRQVLQSQVFCMQENTV